ncbi:hypothetical protein EDD21DRAFT_446124, partial [Dissophora ornata]
MADYSSSTIPKVRYIDRVLFIPEVAEHIIAFLPPAALCQARLVCRIMHQLCRPFFFLDLNIQRRGILPLLKSDLKRTAGGRNTDGGAHLVRSLRYRQEDRVIEDFLQFCGTSIKTLILSSMSSRFCYNLGGILPLAPNLRSLEIQPISAMGFPLTTLLDLISRFSPQLESLIIGSNLGRFSTWGALSWSPLVGMLEACGRLKHLSLCWIKLENFEEYEVADVVADMGPLYLEAPSQGGSFDSTYHNHQQQQRQSGHQKFSNLKSLELLKCNVKPEYFEGLIRQCPELNSLRIALNSSHPAPLCGEQQSLALQTTFQHIRQLSIKVIPWITLLVAYPFLGALPRLEELTVSGASTTQVETLEELQRILGGGGGGGARGSGTGPIRLRVLRLLWSEVIPNEKMKEFLEQEICHNLEELELTQSADCLIKKPDPDRTHLSSAWFEFSQTLTSLRLTGAKSMVVDNEQADFLNQVLRRMPRLQDLAIGYMFRTYRIFQGLGRVPVENNNIIPPDQEPALGGSHNANEVLTNAWFYPVDWALERPFLKSISMRFPYGYLLRPEDLDREIVNRFRFLEHLQLTGDKDYIGSTKAFEQWEKTFRPGLKVDSDPLQLWAKRVGPPPSSSSSSTSSSSKPKPTAASSTGDGASQSTTSSPPPLPPPEPHVEFVIDETLNSQVLELLSPNLPSTFITIPSLATRTLGIKLPILVLLIKNLGKYWSFEVTILDDRGEKRRFRASNFQVGKNIHFFELIFFFFF